MRNFVTTIMLSAVLAGPLAAQEARLTGTVAESFGRQVIIATPEGRILVTLPEGVLAPAPGTRVDLTGTRAGMTFAATDLSIATAQTLASGDAGLPTPLRGLGLSEVVSRRGERGETKFHARLPGGGWIRAEAQGEQVRQVKSDGVGLPESIVAALLPPQLRGERRLADFARITEIDLEHGPRGEIEVEGYTRDGMRIEAKFDRDGRLREYERKLNDRGALSETAARERLSALGYTNIGFVERGPRHIEAVAVNPYGETVEVRLDDRGRVERERLWMR